MIRNILLRRGFAALLFAAAAATGAQTADHLSGSIRLFGGDSAPPVFLESEKGWTPIGVFDLDSDGMPSAEDGTTRRWRLETSYEHARSSGPVTLQIRLRGNEGGAVFTHPWSEGADRLADAYSNWFEESVASLSAGGKGYVEARLIAPPRTPLTGRLYSVSMEIWDRREGETGREPAGPAVQLAYARPLPTDRPSPSDPSDQDAEDPERGAEAALAFSLEFVESCLTGDLPAFYRSQADPIRGLDDGKAMARYRLNPPRSIPGVTNLDEYKRRFDYSIHSASDLVDLFPEWFSEDRPWNPGDNAFLFMGHRDRLGGAFPEGVDYLVFLVEPVEGEGWRVVARPSE